MSSNNDTFTSSLTMSREEEEEEERATASTPLLNSSTPPTSTTGKLEPHKLELILDPEDGSLMTAPLLNVIMACTDSLYKDIHDMAHGELQIIGGTSSGNTGGGEATTASAIGGIDESPSEPQNQSTNIVRKDKMSNLSFVQRRHEMSYRIASHSRALTHVSALCLSANNNNNTNYNYSGMGNTDTSSSNLSKFVNVSTKALTHSRTAWIQNDECQDAMYFFHSNLFSMRAGPHDIYGSLDWMCTPSSSTTTTNNNTNNNEKEETKTNNNTHSKKTTTSVWYDMPTDLHLVTDPYDISKECRTWSKREISERWAMAVRRKLLLGEVGTFNNNKNQHQNQNTKVVPWKIILRGNGIVRLCYGSPKKTIDNTTKETKIQYPIEAIVTVVTTDDVLLAESESESKTESTTDDDDNQHVVPAIKEAEWTLLSVDVYAEAQTGQSTHQLDTNNKQQYQLHQLCALAMSKEEKHFNNTKKATTMTVARPLQALFRVAQYFSLSWQLEILSEQAKALSKGNWNNIVVQPVEFYTDDTINPRPKNINPKIVGMLSISFWSVDDRYGPPSISDLNIDCENENENGHDNNHDDDNNANDDDQVMADVDDDGDGDQEMVDVEGNENTNNKKGNNGKRSSVSSSVDTVKSQRRSSLSSSLVVPRNSSSNNTDSTNNTVVTNRLTLSIRAEIDVGIKVSLSGADSIMNMNVDQNTGTERNHNNTTTTTHKKTHNHVRSTIQDLLEATSNPFALSASEALLAATVLCGERKCYAMVNALLSQQRSQPSQNQNSTQSSTTSTSTTTTNALLPSWITLTVEKGSIAVAAHIQYYTEQKNDNGDTTGTTTSNTTKRQRLPVVLFRVACDSRTGLFVPIFSRSTPLLQYMACNDIRAASDTTLLRIATLATKRRQKGAGGRASNANQSNSAATAAAAGAIFNSGRMVRDVFESLCRSMNVLGQRVGMGIHAWENADANRSPLLRKRAIHLACQDVQVSLVSCCGISVLYGLSMVSLSVCTGIDPSSEMSGGKLDPLLEIQPSLRTMNTTNTTNTTNMKTTTTASTTTTTTTTNNNNNVTADDATNKHDPNHLLLTMNDGNGDNATTTKSISCLSFVTAPPPSLLIDSKLVEQTTYTAEGERKNRSSAEQERFGICCSISEEEEASSTGSGNGSGGGGLIVYGAEMKVEIDLSPSSIPTRKSFQLVPFLINNSDDADADDADDKNMGEDSSSNDKKKEEESDNKKDERRPTKRIKTNDATTTTTTTTTTTGDARDGEDNSDGDGDGEGDNRVSAAVSVVQTRDLLDEVDYFSLILAKTIGI